MRGTKARCELDSHADTCVAGPNFQVDEYTGEHCNVMPYSSDYQPLKDIPIVNVSTAFTDPSTGETIRLQFNQVIVWYGHRLTMSLINPNQMRHAGLTVSDDPTDKARHIGVLGDDFFVPFRMQGTTVFFESRAPTKWEYANCRIVKLTVDTPWNPGDVNIALLTSHDYHTLEQQTHQILCAMERIPRCINRCVTGCECGSDLSVFDPVSMT
jgi:hypothetical protein